MLLAALSGCSRETLSTTQKRAVIADYRTQAYQINQQALDAAQALLAATRVLVTTPSPTSLQAAREAWIAARAPYSRSEALRFGHWPVDELETRLNAWPIDEGLIDYVAEPYPAAADNPLAYANLVASDQLRLGASQIDVQVLSAGLLEHFQNLAPVESAVISGYHAVEFLLWGQDQDPATPGRRPWTDYAADAARCTDGYRLAGTSRHCVRRGQLLLAAVQLLIRDLTQMRQLWSTDNGSYGSRLLAGPPDDALRRMLFAAMSFSAQELAGERLQVPLSTHGQEEEQDCFSDQTPYSLRENASGVALFLGLDDRSQKLRPGSLLQMLSSINKPLQMSLHQALLNSAEALQRLIDAADHGLPFDQMIRQNPALIRQAVLALQNQASLLEQTGIALGLAPLNPALDVADDSPGGATTLRRLNPDVVLQPDAFSQPAANLDASGRARFAVGNSFFTQAWVAAPSSTSLRDGLGPLYNAAACQNCHIRDGRGQPPSDIAGGGVSAIVRLGSSDAQPDPIYGHQLQDRALPGFEPEGRVSLQWNQMAKSFGDGQTIMLRQPVLSWQNTTRGHPQANTRLSLRIAPPLIGQGLLDAIPDRAIEAGADPNDADGDGISGRAHRLPDGRLGRHGWKASQPDVLAQSAAAFAEDMGLSSEIRTCEQTPSACSHPDEPPEVDPVVLADVAFYVSHLAVPARRWETVKEVQAGAALFQRLGCAQCHRPKWTTGMMPNVPALSHQNIAPYSDLLLHDMGPGLDDGVGELGAQSSEWRTPPLWGLHLTKAVSGSGAGYLHDGRATTLEEAIVWHGGEAQASREQFLKLPRHQRDELIWFLKSL